MTKNLVTKPTVEQTGQNCVGLYEQAAASATDSPTLRRCFEKCLVLLVPVFIPAWYVWYDIDVRFEEIVYTDDLDAYRTYNANRPHDNILEK